MKKGYIRKLFLKNIKWIILLICLVCFILILRNVFKTEILKMDQVVYEVVVNNWRNESLTPIMKCITTLSSVYILIYVCVASYILLENKRISVLITLNLAIIAGLNSVIKYIIQRPRPIGYRLIEQGGYSFPSGHSMVSMAFYGLMIFYIAKMIKDKSVKYILISSITILIGLIGFSRVYLGVHYASDVIAGFILSIAYLIVFTAIMPKLLKVEEAEMRKVKKKAKNILNSFKYAGCGIASAFKTETNMKIHVLIMTIVILLGFIFRINWIEWIVCIMLFGIVISSELINTTIETVVDMIMLDINEKAKLAKDISAASVLVVAISAAVSGLIIFVPKIVQLFK